MSAPWGSRERPWPISVGDLDNWTYFQGPGLNPMHESVESMTDADFRRRLDRVDPVGPGAIIGRCFHAALEAAMLEVRVSGAPLTLDTFTGESEGDRVEFRTEGRVGGNDVACNALLQHYTLVEQDVELVFDTPSGWVHLRGVKDGARGPIIRDLKTTKKFEAEKYQDSWQWRAYLEMCGPEYTRFDYLVFVVSYPKKTAEELGAGKAANVLIREFHPLSCYRYPAMRRDLQGVAGELAAYLQTIEWVPPKKRQMTIF